MVAIFKRTVPFVLTFLLATTVHAEGAIRVLLVHGSRVPTGIDPALKQKLANEEVVTRSARYEEVTEDLLAAFHVVVVMQEPAYGQSFVGDQERQVYRRKVALLLQFIREGGGLYVTHDANINPQRQDCDLINETLLAPLEGEVLPETVVDEKTLTSHVARLLEMYYCCTRNVAAHPLTAGVREVWYPCGPVKFGRDTSPVRVSSEWQVVLRGNETAISGGTGGEAASGEPVSYTSAPPLAAVRPYGKGRVFLFPSAARCWFHSAYHREFGGFVLEQGDGFRLVVQALRWLAEPRLKATLAPLPPERPLHRPARPPRRQVDPARVKKLLADETEFSAFLGVVGLELAGGSVSEYCQAARAAGFAFAAFAVDASKLDSERFSQLAEECRRQTDGQFVALPGARFTTRWGTTWLGLDLLRWPRQEEVDGWSVGSFPMRGITRLYAPTLGHAPGGCPPFGLRFWNAIDAVASLNGEIIDDSLDWYRYCAANFCVVVPVASQRVAQPADLATQVRWKVGVFARGAGEIRAALSQGVRRVFITEGPLIRQFSVLNVDSPPSRPRWQQGAIWQRGDRLVLKIHLTNDRPLRAVNLYWGRQLFRCFRPASREFKELVWVEPTRDASFWLEIEDTDGRRALSAPILVLNRFKRFNWCTDHQNLINWDYDPAEDRRGNFQDGLYGLHVVHSPGGGDALGANLPGHEWGDMPPGREVAPQGARFKAVVPFPRFIGKNGRPVERALARPELRFNSQDCYVLDLRWDGESRTPGAPEGARFCETVVRLVNPRGKPYEPNFWLIETRARILCDLELGEVEGPEQVFFEAMFLPGRLNKWPLFLVLTPDGKLRGETAFAEGKVSLPAAPLARRGYAALLPNYWYCPAVFVPDEQRYVVRIANAFGGNVLLGLESPGAVLRAGTRLEYRLVYAVLAGPDTGEEAVDRIYGAYGFGGEPAYDVHLDRGTVVDKTFALTVRAEEYAASGSLRTGDLPSGLLVQIDGLCANWDAGLLDIETGNLRRFGTLDGRGYLTLDGRAHLRFAAGNLLVCDHEEVRLHLRRGASGWVVEAHNPTSSAIETTIRTPGWFTIARPFSATVTLRPGETRRFSLALSR